MSERWTIACGGERYEGVLLTTGAETGTVRVASRRIKVLSGVHHCIVLEGAKFHDGVPLYVVHEWMPDGYQCYATDKLNSEAGWCCELGTFPANTVAVAARLASEGRSYSITSYNCNKWTERVASHLVGRGITVDWNCSCVLSDLSPVVQVPLLAVSKATATASTVARGVVMAGPVTVAKGLSKTRSTLRRLL